MVKWQPTWTFDSDEGGRGNSNRTIEWGIGRHSRRDRGSMMEGHLKEGIAVMPNPANSL